MDVRKALIISFIFWLGLGIQTSRGQTEAQKIINNLRKQYEDISNISAKFKQIFYWKLTDETQEISGKIAVKDGKKYRIETPDQIIVTDGKVIKTLSVINKQVIIDQIKESNQDNPLLREFLERYSEQYTPIVTGEEEFDHVECTVLELKPKLEKMFYQKVRIWVDTKRWLILKIEQTDINDNLTIYELSDIDLKTKLPDDLFDLKIPKDYEIIDLR